MNKVGVLVMAYGGPNSLADIPAYLADIRSGFVTSPELLAEITERYRLIGGKSPLLEMSRRQTFALAEALGKEKFQCYLGMRHWSPWINDAVKQMLEDGITHAVSVVLAPQFSKMSIRKYQEKISDALKKNNGHIEFTHINHYHTAAPLIQAFASRVKQGLAQWPVTERDKVHVIFSAHSLPIRITKMDDPYVEHCQETAKLVAQKAGLIDQQWSFCFQSAGKTTEPWLGPDLCEHLTTLAKKNIGNVISVPVGFVCDHVEILYDIDIQAQQHAKELGICFVRPPALNDDFLFIETLKQAVLIHSPPLTNGADG